MNILSGLTNNDMASHKAVAAFFDVDNTLINIKSMFSFLDYIEEKCDKYTVRIQCHKQQLNELNKNQYKREYINRFYYSVFEGMQVSDLEKWGRSWYKHVKKMDYFFIKKTLVLLQRHQFNDEIVVFVSGSFSALLNPIANEMAVDQIISTDMEIINGRYTGKIIGGPTIGLGKYTKIRDYAMKKNINLSLSYAYADDISDLHMLSAVGFPRVINPGPEILKKASSYIRSDVSLLAI